MVGGSSPPPGANGFGVMDSKPAGMVGGKSSSLSGRNLPYGYFGKQKIISQNVEGAVRPVGKENPTIG